MGCAYFGESDDLKPYIELLDRICFDHDWLSVNLSFSGTSKTAAKLCLI